MVIRAFVLWTTLCGGLLCRGSCVGGGGVGDCWKGRVYVRTVMDGSFGRIDRMRLRTRDLAEGLEMVGLCD